LFPHSGQTIMNEKRTGKPSCVELPSLMHLAHPHFSLTNSPFAAYQPIGIKR